MKDHSVLSFLSIDMASVIITGRDCFSEICRPFIVFYRIFVRHFVIEDDATMRDGTTITIRPVSSSLDKSPAIDIRRVSPGRVKEQKIHFIKDTKHD